MNDSGYVTIEWVYGDGEEEWEPVATLKYWEVAAIRDALKTITLDRKITADYWKQRDPDNHGTEIAIAAAKSFDFTLKSIERVLKKMRDKHRGDDGHTVD